MRISQLASVTGQPSAELQVNYEWSGHGLKNVNYEGPNKWLPFPKAFLPIGTAEGATFHQHWTPFPKKPTKHLIASWLYWTPSTLEGKVIYLDWKKTHNKGVGLTALPTRHQPVPAYEDLQGIWPPIPNIESYINCRRPRHLFYSKQGVAVGSIHHIPHHPEDASLIKQPDRLLKL